MKLWHTFDKLEADPKPNIQIEVNSNMGVKPKLVEKLTETVKKLKENSMESKNYELAYWSKFSIPLSCLVMFLLTTLHVSRLDIIGWKHA